MAHPLMSENVWMQQQKFEDAERLYRQLKDGVVTGTTTNNKGAGGDSSVYQRLDALERENKDLKKVTDELRSLILNIQSSMGVKSTTPAAPSSSKPAPPPADDDDDDDDDIDLFGDDDEEESAAAAALREKRLKEYAERKAKKPQVIAKSNVVLDVKPWDDETDMKEVEVTVRKIEMDGLVWGAAKLVEIGYGIKKLVISCVVEDEKVSIEDLSELICGDEDHVQSVDIAAFNKV